MCERKPRWSTQEHVSRSKVTLRSKRMASTIYNSRDKNPRLISVRSSLVDTGGCLFSKPLSKQNSDLLEQNFALKKEVIQLRREKVELLNTFERLKTEYRDDEDGGKYNERRFVFLKSLVEQKDRHVLHISVTPSR